MRGNRTAALLLAAAVILSAVRVSAHRRDEYLQAARIGVEPDRVHLELDLTPGIAVADTIIREIDRDDDGVLSPGEQRAYVQQVLGAVTLRVDNGAEPFDLQPTESSFPTVDAMRHGDGSVSIQSNIDVPQLSPGVHRLVFQNTNGAANNAYLANALMPASARVVVTGQRRDADQRELTIEFVVRGTPAGADRRWLWIGLAGAVMLSAPLVRRASALFSLA